MEPCTHFQKTSDTTLSPNRTSSWSCHFRKQFEQCALSCSIFADDAHHIALFHLKVNVLQGPYVITVGSFGTVINRANFHERVFLTQNIHNPPPLKIATQRSTGDQTQTVEFANIVEFYCYWHNLNNISHFHYLLNDRRHIIILVLGQTPTEDNIIFFVSQGLVFQV